MPQDVLGIAAHQDSAHATTAVRTTDDQVRGPSASLLDDALAGLRSKRFDQAAVNPLKMISILSCIK